MCSRWILFHFLMLKDQIHLSDDRVREEQNLLDGVVALASMVLPSQSRGSQAYKEQGKPK